MTEFITRLFDTADFPPRWQCGNWSDEHGWAHITADLAIFGAYTAIPWVLAFFVLRRRDVPFLPVFWLFVAFIFFCGFGHLVEATIFWRPWYRFSGAVKVCTAVVSWITVGALIPVLPRALALPGLAAVNARLQAEVAEREAVEARLRQHTRQLERANLEQERFIRNVVDREDRVLELKREVNELLAALRREPRYQVEPVDV